MPLDLNSLQDAEQFQKHFVTPLIDAVRAEVQPLVQSDKSQSDRLAALEGNQKKAMLGFAVYATILSTGIGLLIDKLKKKIMPAFFILIVLSSAGCKAVPHLSSVNNNLPAVGYGVAGVQAHTQSAEELNAAAKKVAGKEAKPLLDQATTEHGAVQKSVKEINADLKKSNEQRVQQEADNVKQALTITEITSGWGYQLQLLVTRAMWAVVGLFASHFVFGIIGLMVAGPLGEVFARAGVLVNPFAWFQSLRDNYHFRRQQPPCP